MAKNKNINVLLSLKDRFTKPIKKTSDSTKKMERQVKNASNTVRKFGRNANKNFKSVSKAAGKVALGMATLGGALSVVGIKAYAAESINLAKAQLEAETKLEAVLKNVQSIRDRGPEAYKKSKKELMGVASELQKIGVIGDEVTLAGMQQLATFQLSEKEIGALSGGMTDLLAQQKGLNATQADAVNISNMIGKAMQGQVGALSRVGISFTEAQEKAMKTGDATQRAAVIAEVLAQNVGGVNKALAETDQGKIQQAANAYGDMREEIGKKLLPIQAKFSAAFSKNLPAIQKKITGLIDRIAPKVDGFIENIKTNMPKIKANIKTAIGVAKTAFDIFAGAIKFVIDNSNWLIPVLAGVVAGFVAFNIVSTAVRVFKAFTIVTQGAAAAQGGLSAVMKLSPIGMITLAVAALVAIGILLWKNWDKIKEVAGSLWDKIKEVFGGIGETITGAFDSAMNGVKGFFDWIGEKLRAMGELIENIPIIGDIFKGYKKIGGAIGGLITGHATGTPYFQGGLTRVNEGGRGEVMNLPDGTEIIPHDVSKKQGGGISVVVDVIVQGNVIGNEDFMYRCGEYTANAIIKKLAVI